MRIYCIILLLLFGCADGSSADNMANSNDGSGIRDESLPVDFTAVCNDIICDLELLSGEPPSHGAATWHPADTALLMNSGTVELVVDDPYAGHPYIDFDCYEVEVLAKSVGDASLALTATFYPVDEYLIIDSDMENDPISPHMVEAKSAEFAKNIGGADWEAFTVQLAPPSERGILRFGLKKSGEGLYLIYQVEILGSYYCDGGVVAWGVR